MDGDDRTPAAVATSVIGNDDLLREILIRLGFPNCLVRAALVSKRWLHHASDPAFLRRFRDRSPPRLLSVCVRYSGGYRLVSLPQHPPELTIPIRHTTSSIDAALGSTSLSIKHGRNGRLIVESLRDCRLNHSLLDPLHAGDSATVLPPAPLRRLHRHECVQSTFDEMFLPDDGGRDGITLLYVRKVGPRVHAEVHVLGAAGWGAPATAVTRMKPPHGAGFLQEILPPVHGKVFMVTASGTGYALGLDLATASFFTLELPVGVQNNYKLSCAEDSGLYLVSADGFQLSVWLRPMIIDDDDGGGNWRLVDTFCVRETCTRLAGCNWAPLHNFVVVDFVGDNAEFAVLDHPASDILFYVHLRSRVVEKMYRRPTRLLTCLPAGRLHISPVMMTWPPIFSALNIGHDQEE